ncbi:MAG: PD-(D/E)XK nuclease family protein, partial [Ruminiclostridium sp.]|nr:PD-(D/E)XK nuclease family protein [Ruminiclostridium sp.]
HVLRAVKDRGGVKSCTDEEIRALTRATVKDYVMTELGGMEHQTPRFKYLFLRLQKGLQSVVDNVIAELRSSDFQPIAFELGFGYGKELPPVQFREDGVTLQVSGFVDRVDGWVKDDRLYLRVVDYKTGRKSFDLTDIWNGLGLQMLLYLFTLEDTGRIVFGRDPVSAGVLYLPARDAVIAGSRDMEESARQQKLDSELVRKGLVLDNPEVLEAMEHAQEGIRFLPLKVSAKTGAISGEALVSAEKLGRLKRHTQGILKQICREIAAGNIDADPFWRGPQQNACQYCEYFRACQFEEKQDRVRWIPTVKNTDFWGWLAQEEEGGEDHGHEADT